MSPKSFLTRLGQTAAKSLCCLSIALLSYHTNAGDAFLDGFEADGVTEAPTVYHQLVIADFEGGLKQGWSDQRTSTQSIDGVLTNVNAPLDEVDGYVWARLATSPLPGVPDSVVIGDLPGQYDMIQFDIRYDVLPPSATSGGLFRGRQFMWQPGPQGVHSVAFHNNQAAGTPTHPADNDWHTHVVQRDFNDSAWNLEWERVRIDPVDYAGGEPVSSVQGAVFSIDNIILGRSTPTEAFPAIEVSVPNIIKNGDVSAVSNLVLSGDNDGAADINGSNGNFGPFRGSGVDVDHWAPYSNNPNGIVEAVNGPDGTGLNLLNLAGTQQGSFYLDTHWNVGSERFVLNTAGGYQNGLIQTDVLDGVTIDPSATYELSFDTTFNENRPSNPNSDFTVALTVGTNNTDPDSTVVTGSVFDQALSSFNSGDTQSLTISGADLLAAQNSGEVNLTVQSQANTSIPNFPGTPVPDNHRDGGVFTQVAVDNFFLGKVFTPQAGDVNKDGVVSRADLNLAQLYFDGNGGETAMKRQDDLFNAPSAPFEADILASLNLTDFDLTGDDYFDQADLDALALLLPPGLSGDYNGDGMVNAADYTVWRNNLGMSDSALMGNGTGDASGLVVQADYALWRSNYGNNGSGSSAVVPEPTSLVLLGFAPAFTPAVCRKRR